MAITDEESAKAWLKDKPREVQVAFAARAALRAAPGLGTNPRVILGVLTLPVLRPMLTSGVAAVYLTPEVIEAAFSAGLSAAHSAAYPAARSAVRSAARSAEYAAARSAALSAAEAAFQVDRAAARSTEAAALSAYYAARSASAASTASTAYSACDADAGWLDDREAGAGIDDLFRNPLWPGAPRGDVPPGEPEGLKDGYKKLVALFERDLETWGFWHRWLEGMRTSQPMDWELQRQVALIGADDDFKVWLDGPEAVAAKIRAIEEDH